MVRRYLRTRSKKKVKVRTPGGATVTHFKSKKPAKAACGRCEGRLGGVPNRIQSESRGLRPSERTPNRPYAGVLCERCLDELVRYVNRFEVKYTNPDYRKLELQRDLTIEKFLPAGWHAQASKGNVRREKAFEMRVEGKPSGKKKKEKAGRKSKPE